MFLLRTLITLLLIAGAVSLFSQDRWVMQYYGDVDAIGKYMTKSYDNGYLLIGKHGSNSVNYNWLIKTDVNGEILWEKTFGDSSTNIMFADMAYNDLGDLYLVGLTGYYNDESYDPLIMKLNACGEKQWCKVFVEDGINFSNALAVTPDGGVVAILCQMGSIPFVDDICLAKFDIAGNLQWKYCYNSSDTAIYGDFAWDITLASDGGFFISGECNYQDPNNPSIGWVKPFYIKTDSLGNFEWETVIHKEVSDVGGVAWSSVLNPASNYYYSSLSHYYHPPFGDSPALLKMDTNGDVVDIYDLASLGSYGKMIEAKFITDTTIMASAVWGNIGRPKAVIIDTLGNIIHQANLLDNDRMAHTEVTFDNKLLFFTNMQDNNDQFDAYLFKLNQQLESDTVYNQLFNYDSLCVGQIVSDTIVQDGCGLIVGLEEMYVSDINNRNKILIYPNPATNSFKLKSEMFEVKGASIEIFDLFGQKIKTIKISNEQTKVEVNVKDWQKGLYLIQMQNKDGVVANGKVIVQ
ncbi:MAG: T9SS type A sorting domain-containing protein [Bacteroidetes bacterium]|nr:T9SS type A sorting domain-containing protein [Bacteroidota bacterium]MBL6944640.1 T9SS type A sorting domain-containing protein [Bacteroidales bacterium]